MCSIYALRLAESAKLADFAHFAQSSAQKRRRRLYRRLGAHINVTLNTGYVQASRKFCRNSQTTRRLSATQHSLFGRHSPLPQTWTKQSHGREREKMLLVARKSCSVGSCMIIYWLHLLHNDWWTGVRISTLIGFPPSNQQRQQGSSSRPIRLRLSRLMYLDSTRINSQLHSAVWKRLRQFSKTAADRRRQLQAKGTETPRELYITVSTMFHLQCTTTEFSFARLSPFFPLFVDLHCGQIRSPFSLSALREMHIKVLFVFFSKPGISS